MTTNRSAAPAIVITIPLEGEVRVDYTGVAADDDRLLDWMRSKPLAFEVVALAAIAAGVADQST